MALIEGKPPMLSSLLEEGKISLKVCPGLETKTHLAGSTDSNKCIEAIDQSSDYFRKLIFQTIFISGINFLALWIRLGDFVGSYLKLSQLAFKSNPVMHNLRWRGFLGSGRTASIPRGICPAQMICVLIYFSNRITSVPTRKRHLQIISICQLFFSARALQVN